MPPQQHYEVLYRLSKTLHQDHHSVQQTLQTLLSLTTEATSVQTGILVTLKNHQTIDHAYLIGSYPNCDIHLEAWNTLMTHGLAGYVYHSKRSVVIRNIQQDSRWHHLPDWDFLPQKGSAVGIPLGSGQRIHGVMLLMHDDADHFEQYIELLDEITKLASTALDNAKASYTIRTADTRYLFLFDDAVVPMLLTDYRGEIVDINRQAIEFLGYSPAELVQLSMSQLHPGIEFPLNPEEIADERAIRLTARHANGHDIAAMVRTRPITLDGQNFIEWVEQDITAQLELEQLRNDLSTMVYHDLRGPLQSILGSIYKLGDVLQNHEHPAVLKLLQIGIRGTRQLQRLVDSLLDIQRLEAGNTMLNQQPVEPRVLLTDAIQLVQPLAIEASQKLKLDVTEQLPIIEIDSEMIMRVVINLMENALKYTPTGGTITLAAQKTQQNIQITVHDSGPGIPEQLRLQIFDKFNRVEYQGAPKGVGLGLAFCRLAVEAHGGRIWVESELGNGSDFIFKLPLNNKQSGSASQIEAPLATA